MRKDPQLNFMCFLMLLIHQQNIFFKKLGSLFFLFCFASFQFSFLNVKVEYRRAWRGVVWCGVAWRGVVWRGVVWCGVVAWCGVAWRGVVWRGVVWRGVVWRGVAWHKMNAIFQMI